MGTVILVVSLVATEHGIVQDSINRLLPELYDLQRTVFLGRENQGLSALEAHWRGNALPSASLGTLNNSFSLSSLQAGIVHLMALHVHSQG